MFELPGSSVAAMMTDAAGGAHLALRDAAGAALANVHQSLAADASVNRFLASQFDPSLAFTNTATMLAASMDQSAAMRADFASDPMAMGAAAFPRSAFGGAGLTLVTDLYRPPAVSATIVLGAFAARPAFHDLQTGLGLAESLAETTQSLLRQITSPFQEAAQRLLDFHQEMWRFDASRLWVSSATGEVERPWESLFPASGMWGDLQVLFAATTDGAAFDQDRVEAAVDALVGEIPWKAHDPRVRRAIAARAGAEWMSPGTVVRHELRTALYLAVTMHDAPQFVRLGAEWVAGDDGRKADLAPHELPIRWFWQ